ncbi:MAG: hypothetical protein C5B52_08165 [Bacteroidetes bacterium]|nr:MAG: hypothetical protein C5B52_08165 [Bacteroidota bacterium]
MKYFTINNASSNMNKTIVLLGEYLLRLTPPHQQKIIQADHLEMHWAGSEANIAVSLSILGEKCLYVTAMPGSELSRAGISQLNKYGVQSEIISKNDSRVGIYYYESGNGARPGRIIYDRNFSAFSSLAPGEIDWDKVFAGSDWFHWSGITPALSANAVTVTKEALKKAKSKGLKISADFNYRSTLWNYGKDPSDIMPELLDYCDVVLADVNTAKLYFKIQPDEDKLVESTFEMLKEKLKSVNSIAMTMRTQNANGNVYTGYFWNNGTVKKSKSYNLDHVTERIGAGDAFMAGLIHSIREGVSEQDIVEFATACGVMKHSLSGDFNIATKKEIISIMGQSGSGKIIR